MPARVSVSRSARADLVDIEHYLTINASAAVAERVISRILDKLDRLAHQPSMGGVRLDIGDGCRALIARPYLAIYEIVDAGAEAEIVVLRVVHGNRDLPSLFNAD